MQQPQPDNIYIDSSQCVRASAYHNDVQVVLPHAIHAMDGYSLRISLHSLSIANTQMCINLYCDTLTISGVSVTLPSGNYSATSLTAALAAAFPTRSNSSLDASANRRRGLLASVQVNVGPLGVLHYIDTQAVQGGLIDARSVAEFRVSLFDDAGRGLLASLPFNAMIKFSQLATGVRDLRIVHPGSLTAPINPLAQGLASAALGPEAGLAMNGISAAAGFANSATRAVPSILHGFKQPHTAGQSVQDLANLQQQ
ncbi:hypothetical protein JKP88DRAFT_280514 [Tribonema minus]|uniref:Uncharacterized protein n=1 Tax=Tribonema minus TaxID=303371 RepID=A0A835YQE6_9STRA|nr:hypothetical protein JKP88DRAFT_280514 [Tribonema minus]